MAYWSSFTHLPQICLFLFASKPPLNKICLAAHRSFPMTKMQICLLFLVKNLSYVSFQQTPIPQPILYISPCFVYLSSGSSCVLFVIMPLCLRTGIVGQEKGKDARDTLLTQTWFLEASIRSNDLHPVTVDRTFFFFFCLMHILVLIDHQPYGMIVLWVSLLLTAHSWSYNNYTRL